MSQLDFTGFSDRKPLSDILEIPKKVQSVYSLTQHVWAGESDDERRDARKKGKVRLETLDEFLIDPVRSYLNSILSKIADNEGQGFWLQAEFGVGKSHLLASTAILALGGPDAWNRAKEREDQEKKAGPGARIDSLWRKKIEKRKIFPVVFSLEGVGGTQQKKLEDFILDAAQEMFGLREGKPLAVYPEEHLAKLFLNQHLKNLKDDLRAFLADKRLMRGLPTYQYDDLIAALKRPEAQRDAGRLLYAFYRHKDLSPNVPTERGERLNRAVKDILDAGYEGILIVIDEMSEYLRRAVTFNADDEDTLLMLSNSLAKVQGLPVWTLVAAQMAHTNPAKIIAPDRLRQETLEHKPERFRDIVVQRTRTIKDKAEVKVYFDGYRNLIPWVKEATKEEFESAFPFPPEALSIIRNISKQLTGTRSTISFLHRALQNAAQHKSKDLVPLWRIFDDLMSYNETPSASSTGAVGVRSQFRAEVAALEAAQATLKRITDGQLARPQNRQRAERILNTLFLYHLAGVAGLTRDQILDAVTDLKPNEDELEAQRGHYDTILDEMRSKLRNQIRVQQGRYEFVPKETSQYDDLVHEATDKLKSDPELLSQVMERVMAFSDADAPSPFAGFVSPEEKRFAQFTVERWHGQERKGRVTAADLYNIAATDPDFQIDTHGSEDDFLVVIARKAMTEKQVDKWLAKAGTADPRLVVWAPADLKPEERATLAGVMAHLRVATENKQSQYEKEGMREFKREAHRAYTVLRGIYARGTAKTSRTSITVSLVGDVEGALGSMASDAMDTCYKSRAIDFGNRKFDGPNAVKLINGLVKCGLSVNEGNVLWSAVENFSGPLGLVRPEAPKRLDPSGSEFYLEVRKKVEKQGGAGIDLKTVYNWFTGYNRTDGSESAGLTRRMVDIYLLCLAQQGVIRISQSKGGGYIDRSSIAAIDFKPDVLRGMTRIELPRAPSDWELFAPYLEVLAGRSDGDLGPKYDKAKAEEALRFWWENRWLNGQQVDRTDHYVKELFTTLGKSDKSPFDELLLYWMAFAEEARPDTFQEDQVFDALRRAVLKASGVGHPDDLTGQHLSAFRDNHRRFGELEDSFGKTSVLLIRAAKFASAPLPDQGGGTGEIRKVQQEVLKELESAEELMLNPDSASTRLKPRFDRLEGLYTEAFLSDLIRLDSLQGQLDELCAEAKKSNELQALTDFASDVPEAQHNLRACHRSLDGLPSRLRKAPEDRDRAEKEMKQEAKVKDVHSVDLTYSRCSAECSTRLEAQSMVGDAASEALDRFAAFLKSPSVVEHLKVAKPVTKPLQEILGAATPEELAEVLVTMPGKDRKGLAKLLKAVLGKKKAKLVRLSDFDPQTKTIWEEPDLDRVVTEFREYLAGQWAPDVYLKIEE